MLHAKVISLTKEESIQQLEEFLAGSTDDFLSAYESNDLNQLKEILDSQRFIRRIFTQELRKNHNPITIILSKFVQTYNIFNKILQLNSEKKDFESQMVVVTKSYSKAEDILVYLYRHAYVRHKELAANLDISRSTLTDTLQILERYECIEKIGKTKCALYSLTSAGRKYVRDNLSEVGDEVIFDYDLFQRGSYQIAQNKALYTNRDIDAVSFFKAYRGTSGILYSNKIYDNSILK